MQNYTFSMLKPDVISSGMVGKVIQYFENVGLTIVASKVVAFTSNQAEMFYSEHKEKNFFPELVEYILSGPVMVQVLKGDNAVSLHRDIIGATDPKQAKRGTIRKDLAQSISANLVHGSDSDLSAKKEISMFFSRIEINDTDFNI